MCVCVCVCVFVWLKLSEVSEVGGIRGLRVRNWYDG